MSPMFKKKPIPVEAVQWFKHGDHPAVVRYGASVVEQYPSYDKCGLIETLEGNHGVIPGDWILKGIEDEYWPVKNSIFLKTYEPVDAREIESDGS